MTVPFSLPNTAALPKAMSQMHKSRPEAALAVPLGPLSGSRQIRLCFRQHGKLFVSRLGNQMLAAVAEVVGSANHEQAHGEEKRARVEGVHTGQRDEREHQRDTRGHRRQAVYLPNARAAPGLGALSTAAAVVKWPLNSTR